MEQNTQSYQQIREQQRHAWNNSSSGWKTHDAFVMQWLKPIGLKLVELVELDNKDMVLDVATGTGEPGLIAAQQFPNVMVIGSDLSQEMAAIAQENAKNKNEKKLPCTSS